MSVQKTLQSALNYGTGDKSYIIRYNGKYVDLSNRGDVRSYRSPGTAKRKIVDSAMLDGRSCDKAKEKIKREKLYEELEDLISKGIVTIEELK